MRGLATTTLAALVALTACAASAGQHRPLVPEAAIVGDSIPAPLTGGGGDPMRGRLIVLDRRTGNCLICHAVPVQGEPFQGDLGPDLAGVASRWTEGQIRLRLVDPKRVNPASLMPAYHRVTGLSRVAARYKGTPVLTAQQIEDVVAWLATLR